MLLNEARYEQASIRWAELQRTDAIVVLDVDFTSLSDQKTSHHNVRINGEAWVISYQLRLNLLA